MASVVRPLLDAGAGFYPAGADPAGVTTKALVLSFSGWTPRPTSWRGPAPRLFDVYAYYAYIKHVRFQFDPAKAAGNLKKHGVSFADAEGVFYDPLAIHRSDPDSEGEERLVAVGEGSAGIVLVVVYTLRGEEIRLISARRATRREVKDYES